MKTAWSTRISEDKILHFVQDDTVHCARVDTARRPPGVILSAAKNLIGTMGDRTYYVYIMTNWNHHVMYIGVTNDLHRRVYEHKMGLVDGFTKKYCVNRLVYCESCGEIKDAIAREKVLKGWTRKRKNELVESTNPMWKEITP